MFPWYVFLLNKVFISLLNKPTFFRFMFFFTFYAYISGT